MQFHGLDGQLIELPNRRLLKGYRLSTDASITVDNRSCPTCEITFYDTDEKLRVRGDHGSLRDNLMDTFRHARPANAKPPSQKPLPYAQRPTTQALKALMDKLRAKPAAKK